MNNITDMGGYEGLVNRYYKRILQEVDTIQSEFEYKKQSHAFAHWFLVNVKGIDENTVGESITDDYHDWSVDAVVIDNDEEIVELYQFKLPQSEKNINKPIPKKDILDFLFGYKICSSGKVPNDVSKNLEEKIKEIYESDIFSYRLIYVSYSSALDSEAQYALKEELKKIKDTGNEIEWDLYEKTKITNFIYSNKRKTRDVEIELYNAGSSAGIMTSENADCYSIYCTLEEIANVCIDNENTIFDENVRLFHGIKNQYNQGIMETASSEEVDNFHLYNNGIVILSNNIRYIDTQKRMKIKNPMVVNGCQTMNSIAEAKNNGTLRNGYVQVRAISIADPVTRQNISIFLNSQTEIKDSYLISNLPIVRQLEEDLRNEGYVLLRQANQLEYMKKNLTRREIEDKFGKKASKTIKLELAIQIYATFFENQGAIAKLNKAKLFTNKKLLDRILKNMTAEKIVLSYQIYNKIIEVISDYRKYRRNINKTAILKYLNINASEINEYLFLNTADIFLLSLIYKVGVLKAKKNFLEEFDSLLLDSVDIIKTTMQEESKAPATLTKSALFYKKIMDEAEKRFKNS